MSHGFFTIISRNEFENLLKGFLPLASEAVPLSQVATRVLAEDLSAPHDWPLMDRSCMDGYAVNARDIFGSTETNPGYLECIATLSIEDVPTLSVLPGDCVRISTGGVLPKGTDAVVMVEHTQEMGTGTIEIRKSVVPGENVMQRGEDATKGQVVLRAGNVFRPQEIGLCAALGFEELTVVRQPRVGILSTGDELIEIGTTPQPGQVRDVNSYTITALVEQAGAVPTRYGIIKDDLDSLHRALSHAIAENDVVLLSGGSSIGVRDLTVQTVESMKDAEILAHGVALSPGKPTILGRVGDKPVLGLPGQVTSALVVVHVFVLPLLRHLQGDTRAFDPAVRPVRKGEDYIRIRLEERAGKPLLAHPVLGKSGLLRTIVVADGLAAIPAEAEGLYEKQEVDVWLV